MIFQSLITKIKSILGEHKMLTPFNISSLILKLLLFFHFSVLFLYQFSDNPIKHQYKYEITSYVEPFFSQRWTLFAPNPINSNMSLLMNFKYKLNGEDKWNQTDWIDTTEPLIKDRQKHFWSISQRLSKFTQSCMSNINETHTLLLKKINDIDSLKNDTLKFKKFYNVYFPKSYGHISVIKYSKHISNNFFKKKGLYQVK